MRFLAVDTETTGLDPWNGDRPFAVAMMDDDEKSYYFRGKVDPLTRKVTWATSDRRMIRRFLMSETPKVFHNAIFDLQMLEASGFVIRGEIHDTMILGHIVTWGVEKTYALKPLSQKYLGYTQEDLDSLKESVRHERNKHRKEYKLAKDVEADYWLGDPKLCRQYALLDVERTMGLFQLWYPETNNDDNVHRVYAWEIRLLNVLRVMQGKGVRVLPKEVDRLDTYYQDYMRAQRVKFAELLGVEDAKNFKPKSVPQLRKIFFEQHGHKPLKYADDMETRPKVDGEFLAHVADRDPLARAVLEHNAAQHTLSNYIAPYRSLTVKNKGLWVLHPNYRQSGARTGRMSCGKPNLMNVVSETTGRRRSEVTGKARDALGPREGHIWYLPDYSQIEVWVFSFLAEEPTMMEALLAGHDFHGANAQKVWGDERDFEERKSYYRKRSKLIMFCKLYGGGVGKIALLLDCPHEDAAKFVYKFDNELPGIQRFMKRMINIANTKGYIENPLGRRYKIDEGFAYRATNYIVQGTSADIFKRAIVRVSELFDEYYPGAYPLIPVHDELVCEIPLEYHSKQLMREIIQAMQVDSARVGIPIPLPVGMKIASKRWSETKEIEL